MVLKGKLWRFPLYNFCFLFVVGGGLPTQNKISAKGSLKNENSLKYSEEVRRQTEQENLTGWLSRFLLHPCSASGGRQSS